MKLKLITNFIALLFLNVALSQSSSRSSAVSDFKLSENICYCKTKGSTPQSIITLDNNWALLLALKTPKSISQLDSLGMEYTMSQLQLLKQWNLIQKNENETYQTSVLLLDELQTKNLRSHSSHLSDILAKEIKLEVINLKNILTKTKRENNAYSILFSYIIDGMTWDYLEKANLVSKREITLNRPLWSGEFWTLSPKRVFSCGTNTISDKGFSIKVNWSESIIPKMLPFVSRFDLQEKILSGLIKNGKVIDKESISVFREFNFFDESGNFTAPIIVENDKNEIYKVSKNISTIISKFFNSKVDFEMLQREFPFSSKSQATVILYHEMLWDILDSLEKKGIITKPIAFRDISLVKPENISDLIVIIKK